MNLEATTPTTVTSPNYPNRYFNNADISYSITAPSEDFRVRATFVDINLERNYDFLSVGFGPSQDIPGSGEIIRLTGTVLPEDVTTPGPAMWMRFTSDSVIAEFGFSVEISAVPQRGRSC